MSQAEFSSRKLERFHAAFDGSRCRVSQSNARRYSGDPVKEQGEESKELEE